MVVIGPKDTGAPKLNVGFSGLEILEATAWDTTCTGDNIADVGEVMISDCLLLSGLSASLSVLDSEFSMLGMSNETCLSCFALFFGESIEVKFFSSFCDCSASLFLALSSISVRENWGRGIISGSPPFNAAIATSNLFFRMISIGSGLKRGLV